MKRRSFLLSSAAAAVGAGYSRAADQSERKIGWALVGLGKLSTTQIAPALEKASNSYLAAVVTGTPEKGEIWKKKYGLTDGQIYNYDTFDTLIDNPDVDVIYIVLPNSMHAEYTIRAAKAGKHVFCEKPMATNAEDCRRMIEACKLAGKKLAIGYRCQFTPQHNEAIRFTREKVFGEVRRIEASFGFKIGDPNQWRLKHDLSGGGALMDVGIYALQACRYLSGEEPVEIMAQEVKTDLVKFKEVDETIQWLMRFPSGITASCATTYDHGGLNRLEAYADEGRFGLEPAFSYGGLKGWTSRDGVSFPDEQVNHFTAEMDAFSQSILADEPMLKASGEDGLRDMILLEAIYESVRKGSAIKV